MDAPALPFAKMHGCGNDYVVVDAFHHPVTDAVGLARAVCARRTGIGSDGLLLALPGEQAPLRMRMFNVDGSEAEMCGNGLRCLVEIRSRARPRPLGGCGLRRDGGRTARVGGPRAPRG